MPIDSNLAFERLLDEAGVSAKAQTIVFGSSGNADFNDLQAAIDACTDYAGDVILVEQTENGAYGVDEEVTIDCPGITIKAMGIGGVPEAMAENTTFRGTASVYVDGPTATITQPCHIQGIGFTTRNVSSGDKESAGLHIEGTGGFSGGFVWLENCRFSTWYGAQEFGIYQTGGVMTRIERCTFDGLFGGFGTAAIGLDDNGSGTTPDFVHIIENYFSGLGSSIPAVQFIAGGVANDFLMLHNVNNNGFGTRGVLLDNNSLAVKGLVGGNWTGQANKAAAFVNLTNTALSFQDNHYDET